MYVFACLFIHLFMFEQFDTDGSNAIDEAEMLIGLNNLVNSHQLFTEADVAGIFQVLKVTQMN